MANQDHLIIHAYRRGFTAFLEGNLDNPYIKDSTSAKEWERGFNAGFYFILGRVKDREAKRRGVQ